MAGSTVMAESGVLAQEKVALREFPSLIEDGNLSMTRLAAISQRMHVEGRRRSE